MAVERYKKYTKNDNAPGGFMDKGEMKKSIKRSASDGYMLGVKAMKKASANLGNSKAQAEAKKEYAASAPKFRPAAAPKASLPNDSLSEA
jgi:hypothetical protein